jgi:hypothetical protein
MSTSTLYIPCVRRSGLLPPPTSTTCCPALQASSVGHVAFHHLPPHGHGDPNPRRFLATASALHRTPLQDRTCTRTQIHVQTPTRTVSNPPSAVQLGGGQLLRFRLPPPRRDKKGRGECAFVGDNILFCRRPPGTLPGPMPIRSLEKSEEGSISWRSTGSDRTRKMARGD